MAAELDPIPVSAGFGGAGPSGVRHRDERLTSLRLAIVVLLLVGCDSASKREAQRRADALTPPVIKESFSSLPCPAGRAARQTTVGAEGCLEQRILRTDAAINMRVRTILGLVGDRVAKRRFIAGERAWRAYRQKGCETVADVYRGGSAQPLAFASCELARNRTHVRELAAFEEVLRRR
jgi:uncharacterized protein YecT (DUF1311 family)